MATNEALPRVCAKGHDPERLGRWTWLRLQGKNNIYTRIVSAYQPVKNTSEIGSTYQQQLRYFRNQEIYTDPLTLFDRDLLTEITLWMSEGDNIVISFDSNQDIQNDTLPNLLKSKGLRDLILDFHPQEDPPETYKWNTQLIPIDGIFASPGISISAGGYCPYDHIVSSDHRTLWVDITFQTILGHQPPPLARKKCKRFTSSNLFHRTAYNNLVLKKYKEDNQRVPRLAAWLRAATPTNTTQAKVEANHSLLLDENHRIRKEAGREVRKLRVGTVEWTPEWQEAQDEVKLWRVTLRQHNGKVNGKYLKTLMKKVGNTDANRVSNATAKERYDAAVARRAALRPRASQLRREFLDRLAQKAAKENNTKKESELKRLKEQEKQRKLGYQIRSVIPSKKKSKKGLATRLFATEEGLQRECADQNSLVQASIKVFQQRYENALTSPTNNGQLLQDIGFLAEGPGVPAILQGNYISPPGTDRYTKLVLKNLQTPPQWIDVPSLDCQVTQQDHSHAWKKQREMTGCDSRGLDFSHYICGAYDPVIAEVDATA